MNDYGQPTNTSAEGRARAAIEALVAMDLARASGNDIRAFLCEFLKEHPTNQQGIVRLFVELIDELATRASEGWNIADGRNVASVKLAQAIVAAVPDWDERKYLPYI